VFKHKALALEGVGFGHRVLSILGTRWFDIIIIPPKPREPTGGGGYGGRYYEPANYTVKVVLKFKGKEYVHTREMLPSTFGSLEKVVVLFRGVKRLINNVELMIKEINVKIKQLIDVQLSYFKKDGK